MIFYKTLTFRENLVPSRFKTKLNSILISKRIQYFEYVQKFRRTTEFYLIFSNIFKHIRILLTPSRNYINFNYS